MGNIKLNDILEIQKKSKIKAGDGKLEGVIPFFTSSDELKYFSDIAFYKGPALIFGTGGKPSVHFCNKKFATSTDCLVFYPKNNNINLELVGRYLKGHIYILERGFKGASLKHISKDYILNIELKLPDFNKQNIITDTFSKIETVINLKKKQIENFDLLIKARFVEMFGDIKSFKKKEGILLGKLGKMITGGTPSRSNPEFYKGKIPFATTPCLGENYIGYKDVNNYITETAISNSSTHLIPKDSLLIGTRVGVGSCSINKCDLCTNQDIVSLISIDTKRFNLLFLKKVIEQYQPFYNSIKRGATIKGITTTEVKNTFIPNVSIILQNKFSDFVQQIDKSKFI